MHLVHLSEDGDVAVVGVLLSRATEARRANGEVSKLLKRVDADGGKKRVKVDMSSLLDYDSGFWRWQGSLTTPPCSGGRATAVARSSHDGTLEFNTPKNQRWDFP